MKVHLRQIPQGGTLHIEGVEDSASLGLEAAGATAVSPIEYSLDVGASEGGVFATGRIEVTARFECVACLRPFERRLRVEDFAAQIDLGGRESADLTPPIREDIMLVLPSHPRCDSEGTANCPATFRREPAPTAAGEAKAPSKAWTVLDKWKPRH